MKPNDPHRLREHPEDRFAGPQHQFDLTAVVARLRQEMSAGTSGHRQETLYKHGPTSLAFFIFAEGARLATHRTNGTVIIQSINGHLTVTAEDQTNELPAGSLLVLQANVQHEVVAREESEMLLTVHLEVAAHSPD